MLPRVESEGAIEKTFVRLDELRQECAASGDHRVELGSARPLTVTSELRDAAGRVMASKPPDFVVSHGSEGYLDRWFVKVTDAERWYINRFVGADPSDFHDHPSSSVSLCLSGGHREYFDDVSGRKQSRKVAPGDVVYRSELLRHRIQIGRKPSVTLFAFGPRVRDWYFYEGGEAVQHDEYVQRHYGGVGR